MKTQNLLALILGGMMALALLQRDAGANSPGGEPAQAAVEELGDLDQFLAERRGEVVVLLLGRDDCPGTVKAMKVFDAYVPAKPAGVTLMRVDVPLPAETLRLGPWNHAFERRLDGQRLVAQQLDFFFYPTLYIFDGDGAMRFAGGCDAQRLDLMLREILSEDAGEAKKIYTVQALAVGEKAHPIDLPVLSDGIASAEAVRGQRGTLVIFARTSCKFTIEAFPSIRSLAAAHAPQGVSVLVVNMGESAEQVRPIYEQQLAGVPVAWDEDEQVSARYGVEVTPFYFLLDAEGKIVNRRSYTPLAATSAIAELLGIPAEAPRYTPTEAG
jgi:peroxiredoxin